METPNTLHMTMEFQVENHTQCIFHAFLKAETGVLTRLLVVFYGIFVVWLQDKWDVYPSDFLQYTAYLLLTLYKARHPSKYLQISFFPARKHIMSPSRSTQISLSLMYEETSFVLRSKLNINTL